MQLLHRLAAFLRKYRVNYLGYLNGFKNCESYLPMIAATRGLGPGRGGGGGRI